VNIAIVVQGRFHAFDLARALTGRDHQVTLFTNYPEWAVRRYGVGSAEVQSYWQHGVGTRVASRLGFRVEAPWDAAFGRWAARQIGQGQWDIIHCWSGVSLELLREHGHSRGKTQLMRGSAHIRTQARILAEEQVRAGVPVEQPSPAIIAREEEEYKLVDRIVVLSSFAHRSFLEEGVPAEKLCLLPLGVECAAFRPPEETVRERCRRILSGAPLRVLYVGALSQQKGIRDAVALVRAADPGRFEFRFVGDASKDAAGEMRRLHAAAQLLPRQPQNELSTQYAWADVFFSPTLQDGFAAVLTQAQASGLPLLCTTNCAGPDIVREGETGWIVPIRSPEAFLDRLIWCDHHRTELVAMVERVYSSHATRDWREVAHDFESISLGVVSESAFSQSAQARGGRH
jgi:glycosyltransferase involved in cell wall biosynthesis